MQKHFLRWVIPCRNSNVILTFERNEFKVPDTQRLLNHLDGKKSTVVKIGRRLLLVRKRQNIRSLVIEHKITHNYLKQYVGQTKNTITMRMNSHLSTIRLHEDLPITNHMSEHDSNQNPNIKIHVREFIRAPPSSVKARELHASIERKWITRLNTLVPQGLNLQD